MMSEREITVLYIAGASRSGSTLIEDYLARKIGGISCGELYRLSDFYNENARAIRDSGAQITCACGEKVSACAFWREISDVAEVELATAPTRSQLGRWGRSAFRLCVAVGGSCLTRLLARAIPSFRRELSVGENCFKVYQAIAETTGAQVILDSSKQVHQYYIMKAVAPKRLKLITLIRDGRAVAASMTRGQRSAAIANRIKKRTGRSSPTQEEIVREAVRAWISYTLNGLVALAVTRKENRLFLRYEDFCANPSGEIERIGQRFSLAPDSTGCRVSEAHAIGGSPSRHQVGFDQIKLDESWKNSATLYSKRPIVLLGTFLNTLLGYRRDAYGEIR